MGRKTRLEMLFVGIATVLCLGAAGVTSMGRAAAPRAADDVKDVKDQRLQQQTTQLATEEVVQRIGIMLRVLEYYQPDKASSRKALERVATTLAGLSRQQMEDVLKRLDIAAAEPDATKSAKELETAHNRHIEIMQSLRLLLAEYQTVTSLDQIAEKLDKAAKTELELSLQALKVAKDVEERPFINQGFGGGKKGRGGFNYQGPLTNQDLKQLEIEQGNLRDDFDKAVKRANDLKARLPAEQTDLIDGLNAAVKDSKINSTLKKADQKLDNIANAFYTDQPDRLREVNNLQRKASDDLKDLASMLRAPKDMLAALRRAQEQLDESIRQQAELQERAKLQAAKDLKDPPVPQQPDFQDFRGGKKGFGGIRDGIAPAMADDRGAKEMSDQQARLALDTRETSALLKPFAIDIADQIDAARNTMKKAEDVLRDRTPDRAVQPQNKAIDGLKDARAKVAEMIAQAEGVKQDPLAALQQLADTVEKLLKEQIDTRDVTKDKGDTKQSDKLPEIAPKQKDLANRTDALNNLPLPTKEDTQKALDNASKAMDKAAQNLKKQEAKPAVSKQNDAIKALQEAKKDLKEQIAEIEKRREDIAKLEEASQKLDKLTKDQGDLTDQAKAKTQEPDANTKDLAKQQSELTPQAKNLAQDLNKAAPKAADKVNQGAEKMQSAQKQLDKNKADKGAEQANKATEKLKEAQAELAKKLDNLKSKELAEQMAMKNMNANAAMQQLQKAMEQTRQAMQQAQKAINDAAQKNLAQLQKELADEAKQKTLKNAAAPAATAAKDISKGDLTKALQNQQKALDKFEQSTPNADKPPLPPDAKMGEGQASRAKAGDPYQRQPGESRDPQQPQPAQAKQNGPQDGQASQSKQIDPDQTGQAEAKPGQQSDQPDQQAAQAKSGQPGDQGQAKPGLPPQAQAKAGQPGPQGQAKSGQLAQDAGELAPEQKALMDATRALAQQQAQARSAQQSQQSNQGAMQALGQAMAGSPKGAQKQMQGAAKQLGQAGKQLGKGSPGSASQSQQQALDQMQKAMQQMKGLDVAKGEGKDGKDGKGKKGEKGQKGQAKGQGKQKDQGAAKEKNDQKANGNRIADGKVSNTPSQLQDVTGQDTFLQLPPRQRDLIRQALAGELPPEFAAQIQQYYLNISRGSAIVPPPKQP